MGEGREEGIANSPQESVLGLPRGQKKKLINVQLELPLIAQTLACRKSIFPSQVCASAVLSLIRDIPFPSLLPTF